MKILAVLIGLILFSTGVGYAQKPGKNIKTPEFRRLMQTIADGWNEDNARKAADCFAENAVYSEPPNKQFYRGRETLFKFFGGSEGRKQQMKMTWRHLVFDEKTQIGAGEFTFEYGKSRVHGVTMLKIVNGLVGNWREYFYESDLEWEKFIGENNF